MLRIMFVEKVEDGEGESKDDLTSNFDSGKPTCESILTRGFDFLDTHLLPSTSCTKLPRTG